ncbi:hypothetical protein [Bacillus luti]|uniref:hypothetical protein n=1 Tax=Bacillus luti TaxID=2026191 RepID=UPI003D02F917
MSIALEERITSQGAYINIVHVIRVLNEINSSDNSTISIREIDMLERISSTFDILKKALDRVDPWLVSTNTMDSINSPISQVLNEITNYKNNRNEGHLSNCLTYIEGLLPYFPQILVTTTPEEMESLRSSIVRFRQTIRQHLSRLENDITDTSTALTNNKEKLNELTSAINDQKTRVDSIVNEYQSQFSQGQNQRTEEFNNLINDQKFRMDHLVDGYQDRFAHGQNQKTEEFNNLLKESEEDLKGSIQNFEETFDLAIKANDLLLEEKQNSYDSIIEDLKSKVQTELDQIKEMNKEAEKILGLMSMKGLAQGYQKIANSEGKKALAWNVISILSLLGILWFGYKFIILHTGTMTWTTLVSRIVLTGVGLTLFTYGAKQATNHRNEERRNRKIELELASLDPYLKDLDTEEQKKVKHDLVNKYFGVELPSVAPQQAQPKNIADEIVNNPQLLQTVLTKVAEIIPKK